MIPPGSAPYAPATTVMRVITRNRERGLPSPVNIRALETVGVPSGNASATLRAIRFFRLIDDEGHQTELFERLRRATTDEYLGVLAEIVREAYHDVLTIVDPSQDDLTAVNDAFRHYEPGAQRPRMVALFLGMCREAGIGPEVRHRQPRPQASPRQSARTTRQQPRPDTSQAPIAQQTDEERQEPADGTPDYRLLNVVLQQLPRNGKWTSERRDKWLQAVAANVALVVEVEETD